MEFDRDELRDIIQAHGFESPTKWGWIIAKRRWENGELLPDVAVHLIYKGFIIE